MSGCRYPQYVFVSDNEISKSAGLSSRYTENALLGVQTDNYQLPLFTKDGKRVELLLNAATRCDASGAIVGVVGVGQDITAINESQAKLSQVANSNGNKSK